jgi:hypothetical protein
MIPEIEKIFRKAWRMSVLVWSDEQMLHRQHFRTSSWVFKNGFVIRRTISSQPAFEIDHRNVRGAIGLAACPITSSGVAAVLAAQIRQKENDKRERADECGDPCPGSEAASAMLGQATGKIDRSDHADDQQQVHALALRCGLRSAA